MPVAVKHPRRLFLVNQELRLQVHFFETKENNMLVLSPHELPLGTDFQILSECFIAKGTIIEQKHYPPDYQYQIELQSLHYRPGLMIDTAL